MAETERSSRHPISLLTQVFSSRLASLIREKQRIAVEFSSFVKEGLSPSFSGRQRNRAFSPLPLCPVLISQVGKDSLTDRIDLRERAHNHRLGWFCKPDRFIPRKSQGGIQQHLPLSLQRPPSLPWRLSPLTLDFVWPQSLPSTRASLSPPLP